MGLSKQEFRPDIQGMRALAVAMVVVYHLWPSALPGGFAGVDVFFVISGFLITGHLRREYAKTGTVRLADFWGRRAKRLMPAAALVLTVTWVASRFVLAPTRLAGTASEVLSSALYFQNWRLSWNAVNYLNATAAPSPVQHFWSISVEEQFYLGWPLLFLLAALAGLTVRRARFKATGQDTLAAAELTQARRRRAQAAVLVLAGAIVVASFCYSVYDTNADPAAAYFVTTTRIWELGVGGLLALLPAKASQRIGKLGVLGWAGLGLMIASLVTLRGSDPYPGDLALLPTMGAAAAILGGSADARFGTSRLTSVRPLVWIGGISYSLYLWHWPIIVLWTTHAGKPPGAVSGPAIIALSVLLSWGTKVWVEDKVRTARILSGHSWRSLSMVLAAAVPVTLAAVFIVAEPGPWNGQLGPDYPGAAALASKLTKQPPRVAEVPPPSQITLPAYWVQGCLLGLEVATPKACTYGDTTHPGATIALVGDSIAGNWFTPLQKIATEHHWKLVTELHSLCPFTATPIVDASTSQVNSGCHAWGAAVQRDLLTKIKPDVVVTSDLPGMWTADQPAGATAAKEIGAGMAQYWKQLQAHGISVVAIKEAPIPDADLDGCVSQNPDDPESCKVSAARALKPDDDMPTEYAAHALGSAVPLIDLNSLICEQDSCPAVVGNVLVYQDSHHLTSQYSLTLAPYLDERLLAVSKVLAAAG